MQVLPTHPIQDFVPSFSCSATFTNVFVKRRQRKEKVEMNHVKGKIELIYG